MVFPSLISSSLQAVALPGFRRMLTGAGVSNAWKKASASAPNCFFILSTNAGGKVFISDLYFCQK